MKRLNGTKARVLGKQTLRQRNAFLFFALGLICGTAQAGTTITYTYDASDRVASVTDPRGLVTHYVYDGLGQLWQQTSPDTGTTSYSYDSNGRRTSMTRANGVQTTYAYDAIGRVTTISAGGQSQRFAYDTCTNGIGRLCSAADATGSVGYSYTPEGWTSVRAFTVGSANYALGYGYNAMGQMVTLVYPDGNQALYNYSNGVVSSVSLNVGGTTVSGASQITYVPQDKGMLSWVSSNGLLTTLYYDTDGRHIGTNIDNVQSFGLRYDNADRIYLIVNGIQPTLNQSFGYDDQSRLVSVQGSVINEAYQYDANGNRIAQTVNGTSMNISYESTSNRMINAGGVTFGYDAMGNATIANGNNRWQYNPFNRMFSVVGNTYYVDPEGQRLMKTPAGGATAYFAPAEDNTLLAESDGGTWVDYLWLNGRLIGRISAGQMQVVHVDQTGRPEVVTNASQTVVWRAQNSPFTRKVTVSNGVTLNIGFPGQYYDAEIAMWNNGYRDYFDWVGRYLESDPIGLAGGINTYGYVGNDPLSAVDPLGLYCLPEWKIRTIAAAAAGAGAGAYYGRGAGPWGMAGGALAGALINGAMGAVDGLTNTTQANGFATGMIGAMATAANKGELVAGLLGGGLGGAIANEMVNEGYSRATSNAIGGGVGAALGSATYSWFAGVPLGGVAGNGLKGGMVGVGMSLGQSAVESALRAGNDCSCKQKQ